MNLSEDQMDMLLVSMENYMIDPLNGNGGKVKQVRSTQLSEQEFKSQCLG